MLVLDKEGIPPVQGQMVTSAQMEVSRTLADYIIPEMHTLHLGWRMRDDMEDRKWFSCFDTTPFSHF